MRAILLVEPDLDKLGDLASRLRARGFTVALSDSAETALDRARNARPDAILVSKHLAQSSDVLRRFEADAVLRRLPRFLLVDAAVSELAENELPRNEPELIAKRLYAIATKSARVVAERGDFRGDLKQVSVVDLLQLLSMNRRTGVLSITTSLGAGEVRLGEGEVIDAVYRRLEGEKALYRLLAETDGSFAFASGSPSPLRRIEVPTHLLLMEGMQQIDEVRQRREGLASGEDALLTVAPAPSDAPQALHRIAEALSTPHTVDELLDNLPLSDLKILDALEQLLESGSVRRIAKGAVRVELADSDQITVITALLKRLGRSGFSGPARLVLAAPARLLGTVMHSVGRIADAVVPAESVPVAPVPHVLATLRLADSFDLDVVGLPLVEAYCPLWGLTLSGSVVVVRLDREPSGLLDEACSVLGVPLAEAEALLGDVDEADPAQMAALIRSALEVAAGA